MSAENYVQYYFSPIPTFAVAIYYFPVIAYPVFAYFAGGGGSTIFVADVKTVTIGRMSAHKEKPPFQ